MSRYDDAHDVGWTRLVLAGLLTAVLLFGMADAIAAALYLAEHHP